MGKLKKTKNYLKAKARKKSEKSLKANITKM